MNDSSLDMLTPDRLARLLDLGEPAPWSEGDAAAALSHQLETPLLPDLFAAPGADAMRLTQKSIAGKSPRDCTFFEALTDPQGGEDLWRDMKEWAKHMRATPAHPLAEGPATALYYAAIAAALVHEGVRITTLTDEQLREGFEWSRRQRGAGILAGLFKRGEALVSS